VSSWRSSENRAGIRLAGEHEADRLIDALVVDGGGREEGFVVEGPAADGRPSPD
jgi:hypothetical protein